MLDQGREADNEFEEGNGEFYHKQNTKTETNTKTDNWLLPMQGNKNKENHGETNGEASEPMDTSGAGN